MLPRGNRRVWRRRRSLLLRRPGRQTRRGGSRMSRFIIHITTLREPVRFFAEGTTREAAHAEGLAYIHAWPLSEKNQPCGLRIEDATSLFAEIQAADAGRAMR